MKSILLFLCLIACFFCTEITKVTRNCRTSLPIPTQQHKYFYLTNSDYNSDSNYIYIYLEDNNFHLKSKSIEYCYTNTNPSSSLDTVLNGCSFTFAEPYNWKFSSGIYKYYFKLSMKNIIIIPLFFMMEFILLDIFMLLAIIMIYLKLSK